MKILLAELETRHYTFRTVAITNGSGITDGGRFAIEANLRRALRWHAEQMGVSPQPLLKQVAEGDYNLRLLETDVVYRDSWPLAPADANPARIHRRQRGSGE